MATVYVEVVSSYSRTVWDPAAVAYSKGDRVSYNDGTDEIYVCIANHTSAASPTPDNDSTNWVLAGSEEYPFQLAAGAGNVTASSAINHGEFNLVDPTHGDRTTGNYCLAAAGTGGTIIMCDGVYDAGGYRLDMAGEINLTAKNHLKARLSSATLWNQNEVTATGTLTGIRYGTRYNWLHSGQKYMKWRSCVIEDTTAYGDSPNVSTGGRLFENFKVDMKDCLVRISSGKTGFMWYGALVGSVAENCTFVFKSDGQYSTFSGSVFIKNCIIYLEEFIGAQGGSLVYSSSPDGIKDLFWYVVNNTSGGAVGVSAIGPEVGVRNIDPKFVDLASGNFRLRPSSPCIGGGKEELTGVYYLQPGNPHNGDGTLPTPASAAGQPGAFNAFWRIIDAAIPYETTIIIVDGTYSWPTEFYSSNPNLGSQQYWEGYHYVAQTPGKVIFDAAATKKEIVCEPYYLGPIDVATSLTGVVFKNVVGAPSLKRQLILGITDVPGKGSLLFKDCQFLNYVVISASSAYGLTGGNRYTVSPKLKWHNCVFEVAFDPNAAQNTGGGLFAGEDGFGTDTKNPNWEWVNCSIFIPAVGKSSFNGRSASGGTYGIPGAIFGSVAESQSTRIFKNSIVSIPNSTNDNVFGPANPANLPQITYNSFDGVAFGGSAATIANPDFHNITGQAPEFSAPSQGLFHLRPNSPLIGKGA